MTAPVYLLLIWVLPRIGGPGLLSVEGGIVTVAILCGVACVVVASADSPADAPTRA